MQEQQHEYGHSSVFKMTKLTFPLIIIISVVIHGCALYEFDTAKNKAGYAFLANNISAIRMYIAKELIVNNSKDMDCILLNEPKTSFYMLSTGFGDFIWSWELPNNRILLIKYIGTTEHLDYNYITNEVRNNDSQ